MTEENELAASIAETTADYREADGFAPTSEHVERWINQFDAEVQLSILREMDHVLKKTYFSLTRTRDFLDGLFNTTDLVGEDPCAFWKGVKFLDIQGGGASQKEMLALFSKLLEKRCGFKVTDCGATPRAFVYLDDAIFAGSRVRHDLIPWITEYAPTHAIVHVITIALHNSGHHYSNGKIMEAARVAGKTIDLTWWHKIMLEDQDIEKSDVLRPTAIPNDEDVKAYVGTLRYPPTLRSPGNVGVSGIFSSDARRQVLESEFLKTGVRIRKICPHLNQYQRPLGNMVLEKLGTGSLIVTFRNCPNNAPLALWAGSPWYPLFPRTTNSDTSMRRFIASLKQGDF